MHVLSLLMVRKSAHGSSLIASAFQPTRAEKSLIAHENVSGDDAAGPVEASENSALATASSAASTIQLSHNGRNGVRYSKSRPANVQSTMKLWPSEIIRQAQSKVAGKTTGPGWAARWPDRNKPVMPAGASPPIILVHM